MSDKTLRVLAPTAALTTVAVALLAAGGPQARATTVNVLAVCGFFGGAFVLLIHHIAGTWWKTEAGRHLFLFAAAITGLFALRCLTIMIRPGHAMAGPDFPGQDWMRVLLFTAVVAGLYWRVTIMIRQLMLVGGRNQAADGHHPTLQSVERVG
jgi:hypothetical protein